MRCGGCGGGAASGASAAEVEGLAELLSACRQGGMLGEARAWCEEQGGDSVAMLVKIGWGEKLIEALGLKPAQAEELRQEPAARATAGPTPFPSQCGQTEEEEETVMSNARALTAWRRLALPCTCAPLRSRRRPPAQQQQRRRRVKRVKLRAMR